MHPQKLQESMFEEEATVRCALTRVNVPAALDEASVQQCLCFRGANRCTDEDVIEAECHLRRLTLESPALRGFNVQRPCELPGYVFAH